MGNQRQRRKPQTRRPDENRKPNTRYRKDDSDAQGEIESRGRAGNHISWYVPDPNLLADSASIPFSYRTGDDLRVGLTYQATPPEGGINLAERPYIMSGVAAAYFTPTYGDLSDSRSAGNVASTAVYSWIRHANSGSRNYDHVDLMLYMLAMDSVYMGILTLQRMVAAAMTYNRWSTYIPEALSTALGCGNFSELISNLPEARSRINAMILKATTLAVPQTFSIFDRHAYMCSSVYMDEPNDRAQYYVYVPRKLWKFTIGANSAGELRAVDFCKPKPDANWRRLFSIVEECLNALYGDEDAGIMSGDILKAYGEGQLVRLATMPQDVTLIPIYDHDMLVQFHNAVPWGDVIGYNTSTEVVAAPAIVQNNSDLTQGPFLVNQFKTDGAFITPKTTTDPYITVGWPLDLHNEITPENVMLGTRLSTRVVLRSVDGGTSGNTSVLDSYNSAFASEIVNNIYIYTFNKPVGAAPGEIVLESLKYDGIGKWFSSPMNQGTDPLRIVARASTFTLFPLIYVPYNYTNTTTWGNNYFIPVGNIDKLTYLSFSNLQSLHDVAMLGLFNVPRLTYGTTSNA